MGSKTWVYFGCRTHDCPLVQSETPFLGNLLTRYPQKHPRNFKDLSSNQEPSTVGSFQHGSGSLEALLEPELNQVEMSQFGLLGSAQVAKRVARTPLTSPRWPSNWPSSFSSTEWSVSSSCRTCLHSQWRSIRTVVRAVTGGN